jgi:hypothetical protein
MGASLRGRTAEPRSSPDHEPCEIHHAHRVRPGFRFAGRSAGGPGDRDGLAISDMGASLRGRTAEPRSSPDLGPAAPVVNAAREAAVPVPRDGEVLLRNRYLSLDPYMRGRMSAAKSYAAGATPGRCGG